MSEERDFTVKQPELPSDLHAEVRAEVDKLWMDGKPWTLIRELRKGVDDPSGHSCYTAQGEVAPCNSKLEAVQYNTMGHAVFFCEKHALLQNEWDKIHYRSEAKATPPLTKEQEAFIAKLLIKKKKLKPKDEIPEETDLMA